MLIFCLVHHHKSLKEFTLSFLKMDICCYRKAMLHLTFFGHHPYLNIICFFNHPLSIFFFKSQRAEPQRKAQLDMQGTCLYSLLLCFKFIKLKVYIGVIVTSMARIHLWSHVCMLQGDSRVLIWAENEIDLGKTDALVVYALLFRSLT